MLRAHAAIKCALVVVLAGVLWQAAQASSPADKETYEKLGLSETEWNEIQQMQLPVSKVKQLLESGISISEYSRRPWEQLSISEAEYIRLRRLGNSDADVRSTYRRERGPAEWTVVQSFFLPGLNQIREGRAVRGWIMAAAAVGSVGLCAGWSVRSRRFQPLGLCLLVPDMLASGIDVSLQVSSRRSGGAAPNAFVDGSVGVNISVSLP